MQSKDTPYTDPRQEADEAVDLAFQLMRSRPSDETIGIVALSRAQADLIELLVEQRRAVERDVEFRFDEASPEPFFVKNLENVQGDERDHIIISIGYGPTVATGKVPNRFGPINAVKGHRRLNVVVSRARRSITVVHSLCPMDIRSDALGARLLRRYLEYATDPVSTFELAITESGQAVEDSEFEQAVFEALTARGHRVRKQIGTAGYHIDLGILSDESDSYDLGIECDGATYHSSPAARDRDWLRQSILEALGWRIHRIWSTAWFQNPLAEILAVEEALAKARSAPSKSVPRMDPVRAVHESDALESHETSYPQPAVENDRPELFEEYRKASLSGLPRGPELQYEIYRILLPMLERAIQVEQPVHFDTIVERIREHYGMARAREASRDQVWQKLKQAIGEDRFTIVEGGSQSDAFIATSTPTQVRPRRPAGSVGDKPRPIDKISISEIKPGLVAVATVLYGCTRDELITETARQFGFDRTGSAIKMRLNHAIDQALEEGSLVQTNDMVTVPR